MAANEYDIKELMGTAGALRLDGIPAFDGVRATFSTRATEREGAAGAFAGDIRGPDGALNDEFIARLAATLGFGFGRLGTCRQVHSARVCRHEVAERRWYENCDGLATSLVEAPVAVFTADCVAILLWAPDPGVVAMVHAGWRGTTAKILARAVTLLEESWGVKPAETSAFLGPAIGACCYEVGEDVAAAAREAFGKRVSQVLTGKGDRYRFDLQRANLLVAQEAGLVPINLFRVRGCTACEKEVFPSWRRDGERASRIMAIAERKEGLGGK